MIKIAIQTKEEAYKLFGLDPNKNYSEDELKSVFKKFTMKHHPDRYGNASQAIKDEMTDKMKKGNIARDILSGKQNKSYSRGPTSYGSSSGSGYTGYGSSSGSRYNYNDTESAKEQKKRWNEHINKLHAMNDIDRGVHRSLNHAFLAGALSGANQLNPDTVSRKKINRMAAGGTLGSFTGLVGTGALRWKGKINSNQMDALHNGSAVLGTGLGYAYDKYKNRKSEKKPFVPAEKVASLKSYIYDDHSHSKKNVDIGLDSHGFKTTVKRQGVGDEIRSRKPMNEKEKQERLAYIKRNAGLGALMGSASLIPSLLYTSSYDGLDKSRFAKRYIVPIAASTALGGYMGHKQWQARHIDDPKQTKEKT